MNRDFFIKRILLIIFLILSVKSILAKELENTISYWGFTQIRSYFYGNNDHKIKFQINKVRLGLDINISKRFGVSFVGEGGAVAPKGPFAFSLLDAYIKYYISDLLQIRLGRDWYKFGWEYTQPIPTLPFINFSDSISLICDKMGRKGFYGYDTGIWINGRKKTGKILFGYNFSLTNGTGLNNPEDNKFKDVSVRLYFKTLRLFHVGVSVFNGKSSIKNNILDDHVYDFEFRYEGKRITIGSEYIYCHFEASKELSKQVKYGLYFYFDYVVSKKLNLLTRYERNKSIYDSNRIIDVYTIGLTYNINKLSNIKANYIIYNTNSLKTIYNNCLLIQLQAFHKSY